jgi:hypothetical protein
MAGSPHLLFMCILGPLFFRGRRSISSSWHCLFWTSGQFLRASYEAGQDTHGVWWPADFFSGYQHRPTSNGDKRGPECQKSKFLRLKRKKEGESAFPYLIGFYFINRMFGIYGFNPGCRPDYPPQAACESGSLSWPVCFWPKSELCAHKGANALSSAVHAAEIGG